MNVLKIALLCGMLIVSAPFTNSAIAMDDESSINRGEKGVSAKTAFQRVVDELEYSEPPEDDIEGTLFDSTPTPDQQLLNSSSPEAALRYFAQGANHLAKDERGFTILMAFCYNHVPFDKDFLNQYTREEIRTVISLDEDTALMIAMNRGNYPQVKVFFDGGHYLSAQQLGEIYPHEKENYERLLAAYNEDKANGVY